MPKKPYVWVESPTVIAALRKAFRRYPPYRDCLAKAKSEYFVLSKKGSKMRRVHWECAQCHKKVINNDKVVDHISPVVDPCVGFEDYNTYAARLFCSIDNLQVLCKACHKVKSKSEMAIRAKIRKEKK